MQLRSGTTINATNSSSRRTTNATRACNTPTNTTRASSSSTNTNVVSNTSPNAAPGPSGSRSVDVASPHSEFRARFSCIASNASLPAAIYYLDGILKSFPLFKYLAPEIQIMIWQQALDFNPRNVPVRVIRQIGPGGFKFETKIPIPGCYLACKEYYLQARQRYSVIDGCLIANDMSLVQHVDPKLWFNPAVDRFCPVGHWSSQSFEVGSKIFFDILKVSKIAVSNYCAEYLTYNLKSWSTFFHKQNIHKWSPHIEDIFSYITTQRLIADVELSFKPREPTCFFVNPQHSIKNMRQCDAAEKAVDKIVRLHRNQCKENEAAQNEGRLRIKLAGVPQWLFDVGNNWSVPDFQLMVETHTPSWSALFRVWY
ncbi:hypothetical protein SBOR_9007 [Sclerotinia borealis F-4128]|uniref:2EXR domain-containing protein n=1 Tax=Sclerotinia borealis (strain F-4128) TaxID=1432307 RepID=W9C7P7_SCLBF|nr:hypothetical protein SBOR_9007 [Sclerotinia borealis F-4128]